MSRWRFFCFDCVTKVQLSVVKLPRVLQLNSGGEGEWRALRPFASMLVKSFLCFESRNGFEFDAPKTPPESILPPHSAAFRCLFICTEWLSMSLCEIRFRCDSRLAVIFMMASAILRAFLMSALSHSDPAYFMTLCYLNRQKRAYCQLALRYPRANPIYGIVRIMFLFVSRWRRKKYATRVQNEMRFDLRLLPSRSLELQM